LLFDIKNPRLQQVYNDEKEDLHRGLLDLRRLAEPRSFKYEVLLAFWLAIHLEKLDLA
jgi:hypothetical protein